jgi:16S rRNA (cytosine1402-N4)-methyltransferase
MSYHLPVLLNESVDALQIIPDGIYVDVTYGGGGHSKAILNQLGEKGKLIAFDQDTDAAKNVLSDKRLVFVNQNFRHLKKYLKVLNAFPVNGILADLGVSSWQFDTAERGFSFRFESELDMRMDNSLETSAKEVVNEYSEKELQNIFSEYGEVRNSKTLAKVIVEARKTHSINTISEFIVAIEPAIAGIRNKYLAQVFQALRIAVNEEMEALESMLNQSAESLKTDGRLVVISYHSLEDRMAKNFMKTGNTKGELKKNIFGQHDEVFEVITKKPIEPGEAEIKMNSRARSAKMRVAKKL